MTIEPAIASKSVPKRWQADLALALVALLWGTTFVVVKQAVGQMSTIYFLTARFWLASLVMLIIFGRAFREAGWKSTLRGLRGGAAAGIFLWLGYMLQTFGLQYTTAGNSGFLTGMYIVLVPLISAAIFRRLPLISELIGIAIATAGMIVMVLPSLDRNFHLNRGDALTLGCAAVFAIHLLVVGYFSRRERFEAVALGQILCAALLSTIALPGEPIRAAWSGQVIFAIVLTGVFATALAFGLQTWGQQYTTATRTALIFALEPVFALVTAVLIGGEALTAAAVGGGALILAGILFVELKPLGSGE